MRPASVLRPARAVLGQSSVVLRSSDGPQGSTHLPYRWLRDACPCPRCVHLSTRQKLFQTTDIGADVAPCRQRSVTEQNGDSVRITWNDGHESEYATSYLERYATADARAHFHHDVRPVRWDADTVKASSSLYTTYGTLESDSGRLEAYDQLVRYGLLFVRGVPTEETSNATCELRKLASVFGELRTTFYGETWDVRSIKNSRNIAYTDLNLGLHMDLLYFHHPPRYQILHCLRNRVRGGTSLFVDAFHAAASLSHSHFRTLATTPVPFHYLNDSHHLHRTHPTLQLSPFSSADSGADALEHVNYSPPFQAPLPADTPSAFYDALGAFADAISRPERTLRHRLKEGEAVLFDNRRVLHARTAFGAAADPDEPEDHGRSQEEYKEVEEGGSDRWLKGCYLEADAVEDRRRVLWDQTSQ